MPLATPAMAPEKEFTIPGVRTVVHLASEGDVVLCLRLSCAFNVMFGGPWSCVSESEELLGIVCMANEGYRTALCIDTMLGRSSAGRCCLVTGAASSPSYRTLFASLLAGPAGAMKRCELSYAMHMFRLWQARPERYNAIKYPRALKNSRTDRGKRCPVSCNCG